ncbi:hypothetical protein, partial [Acutalibacter sp. 1XD8-36]|uniref:hypothetical protein n=1 Tax=Acutalibacter sp. 1XD8-36 TaxID=2320852 RepID=UPI001412AEB0
MNKSKFLKRPLAALLAILMVVALVPMSAFAAEPDVIKVNGVEATLSGDAYSVSITAPNGTASVIENALKSVTFELRSKNGITVGILDKDDKQKDVDLSGWPDEPGTKQTINLLDYAVKPEGSYWGEYTGIKLQITTSAGEITTYPLTVTVSERNASSDTTITAVESTRIVNANVDPVKHHIEIIKPVGSDNTAYMLGLKEENFKTASPYATVSFTKVATYSINDSAPADDKITKVTVTAEDKSTQEYTVSYKVEPIFTEFDVPDMVSYEEKEVDDGSASAGNGVGEVVITVKVPFGTFPTANTEGKIIPTFTAASNIKKIESDSSFTHGDGILYERNRGTTSGVANWAANAAANAAGLNNGDTDLSFDFEVESGTS